MSNKQKRLVLKEKRQKKRLMKQQRAYVESITKIFRSGGVKADKSKFGTNFGYTQPPEYYEDFVFNCQDCGSKSLWTAHQQKWWYEDVGGSIYSTATRCWDCRKKLRLAKKEQAKRMHESISRTPHPNELFFRKRYRVQNGY